MVLQTVKNKLFSNLQALLIATPWWKKHLMNFVIQLPISINKKGENYNFILVIVNWFIKMIYYIPIKVTFNALGQAKVILNMIIWHHNLPNLIIFNKCLLFISKFWSLIYYFFSIKQRLSTAFYLQNNN